jgi:ATP-dependent Lon protease
MLDMTYDTGYGGEYSKTMKFIEGALALPLGKYVEENIDPQAMNTYLVDAKKKLDEAVYGHTECKDYILQVIAQYISKGSSRGKVFGIQGPPGNGKTSLVRNGVCKVLNRPFTMIALGGISDGSLMEGHDFTYEGSMWGKLAQCLMDAKCMNPVIYFDELDKISQTHQGEEIVGILTHLVDFSQNDCIRDRYFNGIDLDYSRCVFVFSFNEESMINPVLRDRIQIFHTNGFADEEKITIAKQYLMPDLCKDYIFSADHIQISRETLQHILVKYVAAQDGVRDLKRKIELLLLKMNLNLLMEGKKIDSENPFLITKEYADKALSIAKQKEHNNFSNIYM